jgi:predicted thioesterase
MLNPFRPGDTQEFITQVTPEKLAQFEGKLVHPVYSTFALGQDAEWVCRLFVLAMKEPHEEGVGSFLSVRHISPAVLGTQVKLVATLVSVQDNRVFCSYQCFAWPEGRLLAEGEQEQMILEKARFERTLQRLQPNH